MKAARAYIDVLTRPNSAGNCGYVSRVHRGGAQVSYRLLLCKVTRCTKNNNHSVVFELNGSVQFIRPLASYFIDNALMKSVGDGGKVKAARTTAVHGNGYSTMKADELRENSSRSLSACRGALAKLRSRMTYPALASWSGWIRVSAMALAL